MIRDTFIDRHLKVLRTFQQIVIYPTVGGSMNQKWLCQLPNPKSTGTSNKALRISFDLASCNQTLTYTQGLIAFSISAHAVMVWATDTCTATFVRASTKSWVGDDYLKGMRHPSSIRSYEGDD